MRVPAVTVLWVRACLHPLYAQGHHGQDIHKPAHGKHNPVPMLPNGYWSEKEKKEYLAGCVSSATKSFEQRVQAADAAMIQSICSCSLEKIEPKHGYNDVNNMEGTEAKKIMVGIVQQCAQEYITKK